MQCCQCSFLLVHYYAPPTVGGALGSVAIRLPLHLWVTLEKNGTDRQTDRQENGETPDHCFTLTIVDAASIIAAYLSRFKMMILRYINRSFKVFGSCAVRETTPYSVIHPFGE